MENILEFGEQEWVGSPLQRGRKKVLNWQKCQARHEVLLQEAWRSCGAGAEKPGREATWLTVTAPQLSRGPLFFCFSFCQPWLPACFLQLSHRAAWQGAEKSSALALLSSPSNSVLEDPAPSKASVTSSFPWMSSQMSASAPTSCSVWSG